LGKIDAVLLSHDHHFDNLDRSGRNLLPSADQVITTQDGAKRLGNNATGLAHWQTAEIAAPDGRTLRITGVPARHGPQNGDRGPVIGFVLQFTDDPENALYISGDTVWYEGVEEILQRFHIKIAVLFLGAARVSASPSHVTFTAEEGVKVARALPNATIVPLHFEGWKHFSEGRDIIAQTFAAAGLAERLQWLEAGKSVSVE
jgi:L-ascorbate metabolism protein UlaG (beta-lactamase superfamily)